MKNLRLLVMVIAGIALTVGVRAQNCPNIDFSFGSFANWDCYIGSCSGGNINLGAGPLTPRGTASSGRHDPLDLDQLLVAGTLHDEQCPELKRIPNGYRFAAQLGNSGTGAEMEAIEYEMTVDSNNSLLMLSFAWVMQNPGHSPAEQPKLTMKIKNMAGQPIPGLACNEVDFIAGHTGPDVVLIGECSQGDKQASNWKTIGFSLESVIGQTIKIYFETRDCTQSGHFGYAYIVCECRPMRIDLQYCENSTAARITAPEGFQEYTWTRSSDPSWSDSRRQISIQYPQDLEVFTCELTSFRTSCSAKLQTEIKKTTIVASSFYGKADANGNVPNTFPINSYDTCDRTATFVELIKCYNSPKKSRRWDISSKTPFPPGTMTSSYDSLFTFVFPDLPVPPNPIHDTPVRYLVALTVITENDCTKKDTVQYITIYPAPKVKISGPTQLCVGKDTILKVRPMRTKIVRYTWDESNAVGAESDTILRINGPGIYTVIAENEFGCLAYDTFKVTPLQPTMAITVKNVTCYGGKDGYVKHGPLTGGASGYVDSFTYWYFPGLGRGANGSDTITKIERDGMTQFFLEGQLPACKGYFHTVDMEGCELFAEVEVTQPDSLQLRITTTPTTCGLDNGKALFNAVGGRPGKYGYDFTFKNVSDGHVYPAKKAGQTLLDLPAGWYYATVLDTNECIDTNYILVDSIPVPYLVLDSTQEERCRKEDGRIWMHVENEVKPLMFWWDNDFTDTNVYPVKMRLKAGMHTVKMQDSNGCIALATIDVALYDKLALTTEITPEVCGRLDGKIITHVRSDEPSTLIYEWGENENPTWTGSSSIVNQEGNKRYRFRAQDKYCSIDTFLFLPYVPGPKADFTTNSYSVPASSTFALRDVSTGTVIQGDWDFGDGETGVTIGSARIINHSYSDKGEYIVFLHVIDTNACTDTISKVIHVYEEMTVYIPNSFTPNGDGLNDTWKPVVTENQEEGYSLTIYDRWGQTIFHTSNPNQSWDGTISGNPVETGSIFTYIVKVRDFTAQEYEYTGHVTVIR